MTAQSSADATTVFAKALSELIVKQSMHSSDGRLTCNIKGIVAEDEMQEIKRIEHEAIQHLEKAIAWLIT